METKNDLIEGLLKAAEKEFGVTNSYASIEDVLRKLELMKKENLTEAERRQLQRLKDLPLDPALAQRIVEFMGSRGRP